MFPIPVVQPQFAPLGGPAEFSPGPPVQLIFQQFLVSPAGGVSQSYPDQVEQLVNQNPPEFALVFSERPVQHNTPSPNISSGMNAAGQPAAKDNRNRLGWPQRKFL